MTGDQEHPPLAYTITGAAVATGRTRTRIKRAIREHEIMALKDGRSTIIAREELQRWLGTLRSIGRGATRRDDLEGAPHG